MADKEKKYEWGEGVFTLLSWFKKEKVKNARVLVAGAGALGNEVVKDMALFGVGHIFVVDFDRIEVSNLTRSVLFREADAFAHNWKAEVVAKRAMEINPQIKVTPIVGNLFSEVGLGLYRSCDVVVGCLDSIIARYLLNRLCMRAGKAWVDGSIENLTGMLRVFAPGVNCYECGLSRDQFNHIMLRTGCADVVRVSEKAGRVATTPISASIIGAMQVQEAMKIIHDVPEEPTPFKTLHGKMFRYEGMTNTTRIYNFASWKNNCMAHDTWNDVMEGPGMSATMTVAQAIPRLKEILNAENVEINMLNNKFIDVISADKYNKVFRVMLPESKLEDYIKSDPELSQMRFHTLFHKSFHENIDEEFPYQDITLQQIGIPPYDVIMVSTEKGLYHVELSDDAHLYQ